jgi:23S rRNA (adenine2503-C2)-methyltransferase
MKIDIRSLTYEEIEIFFINNNEKKFRAKQVYEWLWKKSALSFSEMTNLSKSIREKLDNRFVINTLKQKFVQKSSDGTIKIAFKLFDDGIIESVLIPSKKRITVCISTQVGCALTCKFCATGRMKFSRNLNVGEIYDQVVAIRNIAKSEMDLNLTNIVIMGMGEPLLNYDNVLRTIKIITSEKTAIFVYMLLHPK